jgi:hypothetical protein
VSWIVKSPAEAPFGAEKRPTLTIWRAKSPLTPWVFTNPPLGCIPDNFLESALRANIDETVLPEFPDRFGCIQDSRAFCQQFFRWYNEEHRHSGIALLSPAVVHFGETQAVLAQRQAVLNAAYRAHPDRFVRHSPKPLPLPSQVWINKPIRNRPEVKGNSQ